MSVCTSMREPVPETSIGEDGGDDRHDGEQLRADDGSFLFDLDKMMCI